MDDFLEQTNFNIASFCGGASGGDDDDDGNETPPGESSSDSDNDNQPPPPDEEMDPVPPAPDFVLRNGGESEITVQVLHALINRKNLLIECPPGLERKLTTLKAILNFWQSRHHGMLLEHLKDTDKEIQAKLSRAPKPNKIYVATRNFREAKKLLEAIKDELGTTQLLWQMKMTVLGRRKNYCINEEVTENNTTAEEIDVACRKRICRRNENIPSTSKRCRQEEVLNNQCEYYQNSMQNGDGALPFILEGEPMAPPQFVNDIEDVMLHCRQTNRCPYYDTLHLARTANLVVLPVSFLLNTFRRQEYSIDLENSIILIDDGYDLENLCKEEATIDMTVEDLNRASSLLRAINDAHQLRHEDDIGLPNLVNFLPDLSQWVQRNAADRPDRDDILTFLHQLDVNILNIPRIMTAILEYAETSALVIPDEEAEIIDKLRKFITALGFLSTDTENFAVKLNSRESPRNCNRLDTILQIVCADPAIFVRPINNAANSIIIGSNCIAPYGTFDTEFDIPFEQPVKVHQDPDQQRRLLVAYSNKGVTGVDMHLNYNGRNSPEVKKEIGRSLIEICRTIPNGKIAFFHSVDYFKRVLDFWRKTPMEPNGRMILDELRSVTTVVCEVDMRTEEDRERLMNEFQRCSKEGNALLLLLHRGPVYKDWDLKYESVRGVVHIAIPFGPWWTDDSIVAKRQFQERRHEENSVENKYWYHREAFRLINPSFSCCLQQRNDWGVVIIFDSRMPGESHEFDDLIPEWAMVPNRPVSLPNGLINRVARHVRACTS